MLFENSISNYEIIIKNIMFLITISISLFIYFKSKKLYKLSSHKGIKIFGLSFLYFAFTFIINLIFSLTENIFDQHLYLTFFQIGFFIFYYTLTMAALILVYSLVWKDLEKNKINQLILLNILGLIIAIISLQNQSVMFYLILIMLLYSIIISYSNYIKKPNKFTQLYLIIFILAFIGYLSNLLLGFFPIIKTYVYILTIIIFLIFLYSASKFNK